MRVSGPSEVRASEVSAEEIAGWLAKGATVVLPTETVYGLAVQPGLPASARRVYELKGRPRSLHLPVLIGSTDQLTLLGVDVNPAARRLAERFWPGPLTLVLGFAPDRRRPDWLAGREEVAVRLPGLSFLREVAQAAGPILVTSANGHGTGPKRVAAEAVASLHGPVDLVVDGGTLSPEPSTIVNARVSPPVVERLGAIATSEVAAVVGEMSGAR